MSKTVFDNKIIVISIYNKIIVMEHKQGENKVFRIRIKEFKGWEAEPRVEDKLRSLEYPLGPGVCVHSVVKQGEEWVAEVETLPGCDYDTYFAYLNSVRWEVIGRASYGITPNDFE